MRAVAVVVLALLVGCGSSRSPQLAVSVDGKAVIEDAYDGHLDKNWSCGSLRAAARRLPADGGIAYSSLPQMIDQAAGRACDAAITTVHDGITRAEVRQLLGPPNSSPRCWVYEWPSDSSSGTDGARVCFAANQVSFLQTATHL